MIHERRSAIVCPRKFRALQPGHTGIVSVRTLLAAGTISIVVHLMLIAWPATLTGRKTREGWVVQAVPPPLFARFENRAAMLRHAATRSPVPSLPPEMLGHVMPTSPKPIRDELVANEYESRSDPDPARSPVLLPDRAAELLTPIELETAARPGNTGFVVSFRVHVSADGRAEEVEILENWLDEQTAERLRQQLLAAHYQPARRLGMPVASIIQGGFGVGDDDKGPANAGPSMPNRVVPQ